MEVVVIPLVIIGVIVIAVLSAIAAKKRRQALMDWASAKGLTFVDTKDHGFDERYPAFSALKQGANRYAYHLMEGRWGEHPIVAFEYHYETYSHDKNGRKTHHHYFSAILFETDLPLEPLFIRPEGFFDKITEFFGADDIDFESAEFSRKFYVKAEDRKWAFDVLHARAMEFLLGRPRHSIQFDRRHAMIWSGSRLNLSDLETAIETMVGLLGSLPDYVRQQQRDRYS